MATNVVFVVLDDVGFADLGCYGSEIRTDACDELARRGLRYTAFHTTALCSPTRASLLTGRNPHSVGMGGLADWDLGLEGHRGELKPGTITLANVLRDAGYNTFASGKWHLVPPAQTSAAGPYHNWPTQRGFDRFYGFLGPETNQWHPTLTRDNHPIDAPENTDYHLSAALVDESIRNIASQQTAAPGKPFFLYLNFGAGHEPHQAPRELIDHYTEVFADGWDAVRDARLARQIAAGIVPPSTVLPPRNPGVRPWADLSADEQRLAVRLQAAYAALLDYTDAQIGRLVSFLDSAGLRDDTAIFLLSDNGASQEGTPLGTTNARRFFNELPERLEDSLADLDDIGTARLANNYPHGWAMASNTPLRWYKQNIHGGGVRDPLIVSWPRGIGDAAGGVRHQFHHVSDIAPTVAEITGARGLPAEGTSFAYTFRATPHAPTQKPVQYFEQLGHRGIVYDGYKAVTRHEQGVPYEDDQWELYRLDTDHNELHDLAADQPERVRQLVDLWHSEARRYHAWPLPDPSSGTIASRFDTMHRLSRDSYTVHPFSERIPEAAAPDIRNRDVTITADIRTAGTGVLFAQGDAAAGYALWVDDDRRAVFEYNVGGIRSVVTAGEPVTNASTVTVRLLPDAIELSTTGEVHLGPLRQAVVTIFGLDGCLRIGRDVSPAVGAYRTPNVFTGEIDAVHFALGPQQDTNDEARDAALLAGQ